MQYYLAKLGVTFDVQRIGPNLYLEDPMATAEPAAGRCGHVTYTISKSSNSLVKLTWDDTSVNPPESINSTDPFEFSIFADA
jgi:hypothetical protein